MLPLIYTGEDGDDLFQTKDGILMTKDAIVLRNTDAGEFAEVDTIIGGTGAWAGTTRTIQAIGTLTLSNDGEGEYTGEVYFQQHTNIQRYNHAIRQANS